MRWLLDANIPYSAKNDFSLGDDVLHVQDIGFSAAADEAIFVFARGDARVLITRDLDFANILHFPFTNHPGVVVLRIPSFYNAEAIKRVLRSFLDAIREKELKGALVIVEEGRYRVRVSGNDVEVEV